jgi:hypothetical protein
MPVLQRQAAYLVSAEIRLGAQDASDRLADAHWAPRDAEILSSSNRRQTHRSFLRRYGFERVLVDHSWHNFSTCHLFLRGST